MPHYTTMANALGELLSDRQVYVLEALAEDGESATGFDTDMAG